MELNLSNTNITRVQEAMLNTLNPIKVTEYTQDYTRFTSNGTEYRIFHDVTELTDLAGMVDEHKNGVVKFSTRPATWDDICENLTLAEQYIRENWGSKELDVE